MPREPTPLWRPDRRPTRGIPLLHLVSEKNVQGPRREQRASKRHEHRLSAVVAGDERRDASAVYKVINESVPEGAERTRPSTQAGELAIDAVQGKGKLIQQCPPCDVRCEKGSGGKEPYHKGCRRDCVRRRARQDSQQ